MSTVKFWNEAAKGVYDTCVLGARAPKKVKDFIVEEDKRITRVLESYVKRGKEVVFVEIGSGTGRYLKLFGKKILTDKSFSRNLKYIVGIDFSEAMIKTSIENLVHSREIGNVTIRSLVDELAPEMNISTKTMKKKLSSRVILVNGDITTKPFLRIAGINVVVGVLFGTLGNISPRKRGLALRNMRTISTDPEFLITVFDHKKMQVGWEIYRELSNAGFYLLKPMVTHNSEFTTTKGFYSEWFTEETFKSLLNKNFAHDESEVIPFKHGLFGRVKVKGNAPLGEFTMDLVCVKCGGVLSRLPLPAVKSLKCSSCSSSYKVVKYLGFQYPIITPDEGA